jgi:hypothetical protein
VRQQLKALLEDVAAQQAESPALCQHSERGRARAPSAQGLNPPTSQHEGRGEEVGAVASVVKSHLGPTVTPETPSKPENELRASTTTAITAHATTMTTDADGVMTTMTTASAAGHQTSGVRKPLAGASVTRSSLRASGFQPMCQDMMGTPTPVCGSRTNGSRATSGE